MIDVIYQFFMIAVNMIISLFSIEIPFHGSETISLGEFVIVVLTFGTVIGFVMKFMTDKDILRGGKKEDE